MELTLKRHEVAQTTIEIWEQKWLIAVVGEEYFDESPEITAALNAHGEATVKLTLAIDYDS